MPKSDFDKLHPFLKHYVMAALQDRQRRPKAALRELSDEVFDELVREARLFYRQNKKLLKRVVKDWKAAAECFYKERNEDHDRVDPTSTEEIEEVVLEGFWENPDIFGNYDACKLTDASRKRGPHRLVKKNGNFKSERLKRR